MSDTQPPLEYLVECSKASLESFQLSRLNRASNLQKECSQVVEEWVQRKCRFTWPAGFWNTGASAYLRRIVTDGDADI